MDRQGINTAAVFPSLANYCVYNDSIEADLSRAFAKSYNLWLLDYCAANTSRLKGCALISRHAPKKNAGRFKDNHPSGVANHCHAVRSHSGAGVGFGGFV